MGAFGMGMTAETLDLPRMQITGAGKGKRTLNMTLLLLCLSRIEVGSSSVYGNVNSKRKIEIFWTRSWLQYYIKQNCTLS